MDKCNRTLLPVIQPDQDRDDEPGAHHTQPDLDIWCYLQYLEIYVEPCLVLEHDHEGEEVSLGSLLPPEHGEANQVPPRHTQVHHSLPLKRKKRRF